MNGRESRLKKNTGLDLMHMVDFRDDFEYRTQRRKAQGSSTWKKEQIAGADFETKDGYPHIFSWSIWKPDEEKWIDRHFRFGGTVEEPDLFLEANGGIEEPPFDLRLFLELHFRTGRFSDGGHGKRRQPPQMFYFNLAYDAQAIIKTLPDHVIARLFLGDTLILDSETWEPRDDVRRLKIPNPDKKARKKTVFAWVMGDEDSWVLLPFNRFIEISYLPKKYLRIEPLKFYEKGVKWGRVECWDIRPFLGGGSLNFNSWKHFKEKKIDFSEDEMHLLGSLTEEGIAFSIENEKKIADYAELDANLTARLSWKIVESFESNGVRMVRPYSPASVAERAALDRCEIPTINDEWKSESESNILRAFWSAYQGGHFESVGSGMKENVKAFDITSAYPHVMWWLPDSSAGVWVGSFSGDLEGEEAWDYLDREHEPYSLSVFEAEVHFPHDLKIYPAAKISEVAGCLMNPRIVIGFFTGDEIKEFQKWNAEIFIERWAAFLPDRSHDQAEDVENGVRYPFRPFIRTFYGGKLDQDRLKAEGSPDYDPERRALFKLMINSLYGKTIQAIEKEGVRVSGQLFNPMYAAIITAGCRMRCAEIIRINGTDRAVSVATDGVIFEGEETILIPENPRPVYFDGERVNLGDWEGDGEGTLLMMMSGVYTILKDEITKNTYRGSYSLFLDRRDDEGNLTSDLYGENWFSFCDRYRNETIVSRTEEINPTMRPYSLGEAKVRSDYSLINLFRIVDVSITPCGDSNKRKWSEKPQTFGDLIDRWWDSETWEVMI